MNIEWQYHTPSGGWWWSGRDETGAIKFTITFSFFGASRGVPFVPNHGYGSATVTYKSHIDGMDMGLVIRSESKKVKTRAEGDKWARALAKAFRCSATSNTQQAELQD